MYYLYQHDSLYKTIQYVIAGLKNIEKRIHKIIIIEEQVNFIKQLFHLCVSSTTKYVFDIIFLFRCNIVCKLSCQILTFNVSKQNYLKLFLHKHDFGNNAAFRIIPKQYLFWNHLLSINRYAISMCDWKCLCLSYNYLRCFVCIIENLFT